MKYYLAIDIGASSGRHIVGWKENGALHTEEVYRFPNGVKEEAEHLVWDIAALFGHVKAGIKAAFRKYPRIESLAVDTWAVDYVLMRGGEEILPCYAYRDARTEDAVGAVYWPVVVAVYLGWSFWTGKWGVTWVVWPVAALLFAAVVSAVHAARRK